MSRKLLVFAGGGLVGFLAGVAMTMIAMAEYMHHLGLT